MPWALECGVAAGEAWDLVRERLAYARPAAGESGVRWGECGAYALPSPCDAHTTPRLARRAEWPNMHESVITECIDLEVVSHDLNPALRLSLACMRTIDAAWGIAL